MVEANLLSGSAQSGEMLCFKSSTVAKVSAHQYRNNRRPKTSYAGSSNRGWERSSRPWLHR